MPQRRKNENENNAPQASFFRDKNAPHANFMMMICFYYHSWRNNVVIAFGTLSSFLT